MSFVFSTMHESETHEPLANDLLRTSLLEIIILFHLHEIALRGLMFFLEFFYLVVYAFNHEN